MERTTMLLLLPLLLLAEAGILLAHKAGANEGCPVGKGLCVPKGSCTEQTNHHKCRINNQPADCCITPNCKTIGKEEGRCLAEDQFQANGNKYNPSWKDPNNRCFRGNGKERSYCCPLEPLELQAKTNVVYNKDHNDVCQTGVCADPAHCRNDPNGNRNARSSCLLGNRKRGVCCSGRLLITSCTTSNGIPGRCMLKNKCNTKDQMEPHSECFRKNGQIHSCCPSKVWKPEPVRLESAPTHFADNAFPTCTTKYNHNGTCVPLPQCYRFSNDNYTLVDKKHKCHTDTSDSTSVCCANYDENHRQATQNYLNNHKKKTELLLEKCGKVDVQDRILGGSEAALGQFPWMANLMRFNGTTYVSVCGGSLIHERYVLTAAHCFPGKNNPKLVRLGEHDLSKTIDCKANVCATNAQNYDFTQIIHERYYERGRLYDIALLKLKQTARIIPRQVVPICLPVLPQWLMMKPSKLIASGWGMTNEKTKKGSNVLNSVTLATLPWSKYCKSEQFICARGTEKETHCKGDSGGPLQQYSRFDKSFRMVIYGVISAGVRKCSVEDKNVGVSTSVGYHLKWILDNMQI